MKTRSAVVKLANSWLGKNEADSSFKEIIDIYNTLPVEQLPRRTKMLYSWEWCACTWSALAIKLGYTDIMPLEISCYYIIERAKQMGIWIEQDNRVPKLGEAVLYDWGDGTNYATTDNVGIADHIGVVVEVNKNAGYFVVVEGNYNGAVRKRTLSVNGRYIRGFISPKYDEEVVTTPTQTTIKSMTASDYATHGPDNSLKGTYVTTADLYMRNGADTSKKIMVCIPKGTEVRCYGYYSIFNGVKWYYIQVTLGGVKYTGFSSSKYLKRV